MADGLKLLTDEKEIVLFVEHQRLKTFQKWPNDPDWTCTPEKLAAAGFYFRPSPEAPDNVCCPFCNKELDGWEPDDDPYQEHKKHSPRCSFLLQRKPIEDLTVTEFTRMLMNIAILRTEKIFDHKAKELEAASAEARKLIIENNVV
ncbi:baculoviral IAP repeat-containing protein 5 [Aplysia californica]|uniref:Baculoviral IAP repeat-containing protein 5 n=1 Tax=Aplysia californica TaxID=6500 RepID=A0ABM0K3V2_APLCA|nr:baculoviral IAP repeat-containing protein 5 [Aplysia californica]